MAERPTEQRDESGPAESDGGASSAARARTDALRLALVSSAGARGQAEILASSLQQAVAGLCGVGGLVHLTGRARQGLKLAATDLPSDLTEQWDSIDVASDSAPARAVRENRVAWSPPVSPTSADSGCEDLGVLAAPISLDGAPIGAVSVLLDDLPAADRQQFLTALADLTGDGLRETGVPADAVTRPSDRTDGGRKAAQVAAVHEHRVAKLNAALVRALSTSDVVGAIRRHVLPLFEAGGVLVIDDTGPVPRLVGHIGYSQVFLQSVSPRAPAVPADAAAAGDAVRPPFLSTLDDLALCSDVELAAFTDFIAVHTPRFYSSLMEVENEWPAMRSLIRRSGKKSWAVLPLAVGVHRVGCCVIGWTEAYEFTESDRSLLTELAGFIAQALGNARLYEEARNRAQRLQQELLPGTLPDLGPLRAAGRYHASAGQEVGGDWYDAVPLPSGRVLAIVGDVTGHGLEQAITMGIIRHAALAIAALDLPVEELMAHLNDVVGRLSSPADDPAISAVCLAAVLDPADGTCSLVSAGHPGPILIRPGRDPELVPIPAGRPLGDAATPPAVTKIPLAEDAVLILYTDGLWSGHAPDTAALTSAIASYTEPIGFPVADGQRGAWLDGLCDAITTVCTRDPGQEKDAALLAVYAARVPSDRIAAWDLVWAPESASQARSLTADQLATWRLDDCVDAAVLIVSELFGNTVRHAIGLGGDVAAEDAGVIRLRLLHLGDSLVLEVYDGSEATPRVRHPGFEDEFGRGLQLVAMSADRWGARYAEGGKCIWATLETRTAEETRTSLAFH
ncbi:SpoIIE family protein phosphatase [Yinghuangia aomiensis]|uniref:SpoIIE family protein phosphatase n=1 Tax=Yinghuangia aomiensis TaxID=676205 RepID=UPI0031EA22F7